MEVAYNLRYQKQNFSSKTLLDKEGEVIIYGKGFRLKGKGAGDKGELINFSEIKEFYSRDAQVIFVTFNKEKYILSEASTLFDQLVIDLYKARNEFLMDALFMKSGKLRAEYDCTFNRVSKFGKPINKGTAKVRLYDGSLVIIPEAQDAFSIHYNFVNFYEFDDMDYSLKIVMDDGVNLFLAQMGNDFEFFQEKWEGMLGGMYQELINGVLKEAFPHFDAATLLQLGYKMKGGKGVSLFDIKKINSDLAVAIEEFIYEDENLAKKMEMFKGMVDDYSIFYGMAKDETVKGGFVRWLMVAVPDKNVVAFSMLPRWVEGGSEDLDKRIYKHPTYFFRVIMEKGRPADKLEDKILEINQALVNLSFVKDPCYKDKRDLRHSPYKYAIRKLPYLRILRKSFCGRASSPDVADWQAQAKKIMDGAEI
jgi:hypothetical protein